MSKLFQLAAGVVIAVGMSFSAQAQSMKYTATMTSAEEVPANASTGKGRAELTLNTTTKELTWNITWEGLTSDAVAAHIHGPADKGANAGVQVQLGVQGTPPKSPLTGKATLTDAQIADLNAGKFYVNVHTPMNKGGEIRGQVSK
jgi:Cu/Zn superoxide dismutase